MSEPTDLAEMAAKKQPVSAERPADYNSTSDQRPTPIDQLQAPPAGTGEVSTLTGDTLPGEVETKNATFSSSGGKAGKGDKAHNSNNVKQV